jgi:hypothetical protein
MTPQKPTPQPHAQVLRDRKQLARLTIKLQRTFESVERIQGKIAQLLARSSS